MFYGESQDGGDSGTRLSRFPLQCIPSHPFDEFLFSYRIPVTVLRELSCQTTFQVSIFRCCGAGSPQIIAKSNTAPLFMSSGGQMDKVASVAVRSIPDREDGMIHEKLV